MQRLYGDGNMALFRNKYRLESARLKGWDYRSAGHYFVTICTRNREHFFGEVTEGDMHLTAIGAIALQFWAEIPLHHMGVELDEFVVMPNHVHGIIVIVGEAVETLAVETLHATSLRRGTEMSAIAPKAG